MAAHAERQVKRVEVAKGVYQFFEGKFKEVGKNLFWTVDQISGGVEKAKVTEQVNLMAALGLICVKRVVEGENVFRWQGYQGFHNKYIQKK